MINASLMLYQIDEKNDRFFEVITNLPKIPIVGEHINCSPSDDTDCEDWIIISITHYISRNGQYNYVAVECKSQP
jgi:hypothetical protein